MKTNFQTKSIAYKPVLADGSVGTFSSATILLPDDSTTVSALTFYLSADGGTTWEHATYASRHTFSTRGNDLRLRIVGESGTVVSLGYNRLTVSYTYS